MATVDKLGQNEEDNTTGATPLGQPAPQTQTQSESAAPSGDPSPSTIQSSATPQAPKTTSKSGKASSGMFTNIQNYVQKNQPQAQKMAENTLGEIRKAKESQDEAQKQALSQFSGQTEQGGLHDTAARKSEIEAYTSQQAGLQQPQEGQTGIDEDQFQNIINAQYEGPRNLTETGNIYSQLQEQASKSAEMGELAQSEQGRGQLLKNLATRGGRQYGAGMSKLDSMLVGQQQDQLKDIEQAGRDIGSAESIMQGATQGAKDIADQRAVEVEATKNQAREAFQILAAERQGQIDSRVGDVIENWDKLPQYYRDIFSNSDGSVNLSTVEAATLGMGDSTRLFNVADKYGVDNLFGGVEADKTKLISQDEQSNLARLQALSNLATQTGGEKLYDIGDYFDESQAGTQSAFDALNLQNFADKLAQTEKDFQKEIDTTQTGSGHKKVSRGNWRGTKTKHYYATAQDKLANQLAKQQDQAVAEIMRTNPEISAEDAQQAAQNLGYGYKSGDVQSLDTNPELLSNLAKVAQEYNLSAQDGKIGLDTSTMNDQSGGLTTYGAGSDGAILDAIGEGAIGDDLARILDFGVGVTNIPGNVISGVGESIKDSGALGDIGQLGGNIVSNLGNLLSGFGSISTSSMNKFGSAVAQDQANRNLLAKLQDQQSRLGTSNVAKVVNDEQTNERTNALLDILKNLDITNK